MERGKFIVAPVCFRAYARGTVISRTEWTWQIQVMRQFWQVWHINHRKNLQHSYLPRIVFILQHTTVPHTHTHTKIIKHPQTPNKRNPHIMIHLNLSGFHDWNHHLINQIISSSFQNKIPMLKKIAPLFYFLFKSNIIHQPLLKVTHRILHHLAYNSNSDHTTKAIVS